MTEPLRAPKRGVAKIAAFVWWPFKWVGRGIAKSAAWVMVPLRVLKVRKALSLAWVVLLTGLLLGLSLWQGHSPLLGLDLQGGVEVVLRPASGQSYATEDIDLSTDIIRRRVDGLGVAEPDITRQGNNVVVQLPGVDDQDRAVELVGQTAELTFRPVILSPTVWFSEQNQAAADNAERVCNLTEEELTPTTTTTIEGEADPEADPDADPEADPDIDPGADPDATTTTALDSETEADSSATTAPESETNTTTTTTTTVEPEAGSEDDPADTTTTTAPNAEEASTEEASTEEASTEETSTEEPVGPIIEEVPEDTPEEAPEETPAEEIPFEERKELLINSLIQYPGAGPKLCQMIAGEYDDPQETEPEDIAVFQGPSGPYLLSPTKLTGAGIDSARAELQGIATWVVALSMKSGEEGIDKFNELALLCYRGGAEVGRADDAEDRAECQSGQLGIVLDGNVESAPTVESPQFERDEINISGSFSERGARELALVLRYGSLPVEFDDPRDSGLHRTVSATLGSDSLRAGIIAGAVGMALVAAYILFYYRMLGLMALLSLLLSGTMLWVVVSYLSESRGLALTLAGITGLIVSLGVSLDSNVVYFENLKEGVANGRTVISAVSQAFPIAFKTIFWANLATLIGAAVLWWLTIGSVKGFAAMLAIASILDLIATYFFLRPAVRLLAASKLARRNPKVMGMPTDMVVAVDSLIAARQPAEGKAEDEGERAAELESEAMPGRESDSEPEPKTELEPDLEPEPQPTPS